MIVHEYLSELQATDVSDELIDLGIDENFHIGFQDQTKNLIQLLDRIGSTPRSNNPRCFNFGESGIVADIRDGGHFMLHSSVKNPEYYSSVLWLFLGSYNGKGITNQNYLDMKTVALETINFGLEHTAPFIICTGSDTKYGQIIPSSDYLLHS